MNFSEVQQLIISKTGRRDKILEIDTAINQAVLYCTINGDFDADKAEATLAIDPALYGDTISLTGLVRFRRFTYVKPTGKKYYLTKTTPDKIFTPKNQMQPNRYYITGTDMTYVLSELNTSLEVEYLLYPLKLDALTNPNHWMLDLMPYAIIDMAAAVIYQSIGADSEARQHERSGMEFFTSARNDIMQGG